MWMEDFSVVFDYAGSAGIFRIGGLCVLYSNDKFWDVYSDGEVVGHITRCCYSPRLEHNIALVNVPTELSGPGTQVQLDIHGTLVDAEITALPWFQSHKTIPEEISWLKSGP